jgi:CHRD domain
MKTLYALLIVLGVTLVLATDGHSAVKPSFVAKLTGSQEVPPVKTKAHGEVLFYIGKDQNELRYKLIVKNIENATMAHLHLASKGKNGDHIAWVYPSAPPPKLKSGKFSGMLAEGTIKAADLQGPMAGKTIGDLVEKIKAGDVYVNVHTDQNKDGEIRGQVR